MKTWRCVNCGHEVFANEKPNLKWADGHICSFMEEKAIGVWRIRIIELERKFQELREEVVKLEEENKKIKMLAANYLAWQSEKDRMHKPCRESYEALRDYVLEE